MVRFLALPNPSRPLAETDKKISTRERVTSAPRRSIARQQPAQASVAEAPLATLIAMHSNLLGEGSGE